MYLIWCSDNISSTLFVLDTLIIILINTIYDNFTKNIGICFIFLMRFNKPPNEHFSPKLLFGYNLLNPETKLVLKRVGKHYLAGYIYALSKLRHLNPCPVVE